MVAGLMIVITVLDSVAEGVTEGVSDSHRMSIARSAVDAIRPSGATAVKSAESEPINYLDETDVKGTVYRELRIATPATGTAIATTTANLIDGQLTEWRVFATRCEADGSIRIFGAQTTSVPIDLEIDILPGGGTATMTAEVAPALSGFPTNNSEPQTQRCWNIRARQEGILRNLTTPSILELRESTSSVTVPTSSRYTIEETVSKRLRATAPQDEVRAELETGLATQGWTVTARNCDGIDPNYDAQNVTTGGLIEETEFHHVGDADVLLVTYWVGNYTDLGNGRTVDIRMHDPATGWKLTTGHNASPCPPR